MIIRTINQEIIISVPINKNILQDQIHKITLWIKGVQYNEKGII